MWLNFKKFRNYAKPYKHSIYSKSNKRNIAPACYPLAIRFLHFISGSLYILTKVKKLFLAHLTVLLFSNKFKLHKFNFLIINKLKHFINSFKMVYFDIIWYVFSFKITYLLYLERFPFHLVWNPILYFYFQVLFTLKWYRLGYISILITYFP